MQYHSLQETNFFYLETPFDFQELHPKESKYKYILNSDLVVYIPIKHFGKFEFSDTKNDVWLRTYDKKICISKNYAWDGCSPKINIFNRFVGTFDFQDTILASCVHDSLYQFLHHSCINQFVSRKDVDYIFYRMMNQMSNILFENKKNKKLLSKVRNSVYFYSVFIFGGIFRAFGNLNREITKCKNGKIPF